MAIKIFNQKAEDTGKTITLNKKVFGVEPDEGAIYSMVRATDLASRQGTHKAKERGYIKGSTRKLRKQKGSGMARVGSIKNPLFKGGGRVFGPKPRDYSLKINKKFKKVAKISALSKRAKAKEIMALDTIEFDKPATKEYFDFLKKIKLSDTKTCLILDENVKNVYLSARNIPNAKVVSVNELGIKDILNHSKLLFTVKAIKAIEKLYLN